MSHPLDISDFRQMIIGGPAQFAEGMRIAADIRVKGDFDKIIISGMGGSGLHGNLLHAYLKDFFRTVRPAYQPIALYQNRSYALPPESFRKGLNFICSYSGNTEEIIASFEEAIQNKLPCVALSAGGKLEEIAKKYGIPHVKLPLPSKDFQPRAGTGYFFGAIFRILVNQEMLPPEVTAALVKEAEMLSEHMGDLEEQGKALAKRLVGKTPVIYATGKYHAVAMVWKIKMNENAKTPAFYNSFPELNHNEMVGWTLPQGKFFIIMLRDAKTHPRIFKRFEVTAELLRERGVEVEIIDMIGESVFSKMFLNIILGDFAAYYLALEYGQDPTPVAMVEKLKALLVA